MSRIIRSVAFGIAGGNIIANALSGNIHGSMIFAGIALFVIGCCQND